VHAGWKKGELSVHLDRFMHDRNGRRRVGNVVIDDDNLGLALGSGYLGLDLCEASRPHYGRAPQNSTHRRVKL
jgi:hypothetical protein